jgi:hypothetical protein
MIHIRRDLRQQRRQRRDAVDDAPSRVFIVVVVVVVVCTGRGVVIGERRAAVGIERLGGAQHLL